MGIAIPQVITEDRAGGAQVIDGSVGFSSTRSYYLTRTWPAGAHNRKTWTWSSWVKFSAVGKQFYIWGAGPDSSTAAVLAIGDDGSNLGGNVLTFWNYVGGAYQARLITTQVFRDPSAWYHIVLAVDMTQATSTNRIKMYVNGTQITQFSTATYFSQDYQFGTINSENAVHLIGTYSNTKYRYSDGYSSQCYFIDAQQLDPSYFGFTDPLTNTWRPKKYTGTFGTNSFYLPMDGNTPVGQDISGKGTNFTPTNFGGSNTIEKATGALPILNTDGGGKVARVGVRTDSSASSLVLALPLVGIKSDFSNAINSGTSNKAITANGGAAGITTISNFYGGSFYFDGTGDYLTVSPSPDASVGTGDFCYEGWFYMPTASGTYLLFDSVQGTGVYLYTSSSSLYFYIGSGQVGSSACLVSNKWHHIAFTRESGTCRIFCDGILVGSGSNSGNVNGSTLTIGRRESNGTYEYSGYIQDVRVYKGTAKYTQNFIPASTDPDILPDTPSGVAYSSNVALTDGAVAFDGTGDYLSLGSSADFDFGTGNFTIEGFFYTSSSTGNQTLVASKNYYTVGYNGNWVLRRSDASNIAFATYNGQASEEYAEFAAPTALNVWYHFALVREGTGSNQTKFYFNGSLAGTMTVSKSLTDGGNGIYIGDDVAGANGAISGFISNLHVIKGTALYTSNFTPPTVGITSVANTKLLCCKSQTDAEASIVAPSQSINDGTVWSSGTLTNSLGYLFTTSGFLPAKSFDGNLNNWAGNNNGGGTNTWTAPKTITVNSSLRVYVGTGAFVAGTTWAVNGTNQGSTTNGAWLTASVSTPYTLTTVSNTLGSSATGAFFSAIEVDGVILVDNQTSSIISVDAQPSNFNPFNVNINTQRGQESGYATLSPLSSNTSYVTLSNGNLNYSYNSAGPDNEWTSSTILLPSSGKYYAEITLITVGGYCSVSLVTQGGEQQKGGASSTDIVFSNSNHSPGDVGGILMDIDAGTFSLYRNNVLYQTNTGVNYNKTTLGLFGANGGVRSWSCSINFGQKPFKFPPPAGHQPLALANLPRPTIARPDQFVGIVTYSGNSAARSLSVGFKPDLVWIKGRGPTAYNGRLIDSVRGVTKELYSAETTLETTQSQSLTSFNSNGFSVGTLAQVNNTSESYVAWAWKAGGNSNIYNINDVGYATTTAAGLTAGTITPTGASVNTKSGFSIVTYTGNANSGATVGHGLGVAPSLVIIKDRGAAFDWRVWTTSFGTGNALSLNSPTGTSSNSPVMQAAPSSTVMSLLGSGYSVNNSGNTYVAYLWSEVAGYSKFGSYVSNNSADGPFIFCGFKPKLVWLKKTSAASNWFMYDVARNEYNVTGNKLYADSSAAENGEDGGSTTSNTIDILSNGFKLRTNNGTNNGGNYIFCAWAETPTQNLFGGQSNAR